jgi:hypothetical protein
MQRNDQAEKRKVYIDGTEVAGLVSCGEMKLEKGTIEVPEFSKIRIIQNGIMKYPPYELKYKLSKGTSTLSFFRTWFEDNEIHDVTIVRCDAHGGEFARTLLRDCEMTVYTEPEVAAENPPYAQIAVTIVPFEIITLDAA